jgi:hypothetical protein
MKLETVAEWLDGMINEAIAEDKNLVGRCCSIASGEYYCTLCILACLAKALLIFSVRV